MDMRFVLQKLSVIGNQKLYNVSSKTLQLYTPQSMCLPSPIFTAFFTFFQVLAFFRLLPGLPSGHFPTPLKSCVIFFIFTLRATSSAYFVHLDFPSCCLSCSLRNRLYSYSHITLWCAVLPEARTGITCVLEHLMGICSGHFDTIQSMQHCMYILYTFFMCK